MTERLVAQRGGKAMARNEVIELLESGVDAAKVAEAAQQYGIAFEMTAEAETQLRDAGATEDLMKALRKLAPKPASVTRPAAQPSAAPVAGPPVLLVEVMPGGAQVYVDDEPMGTTSQVGRLKLSQVQAGAHRIRVSLAGHRDFEQSVELAAGQTARVTGTLNAAAPSPATNPLAADVSQPSAQQPQASERTPVTATGEPGALGVQVATNPPAGTRGAYVTAVAPGSPAERAGLRAGQSVVSVNGQPINSSQELLQTITQFRADQVVQIGYLDGGTLRSTQAQLVRRAASAAAASSQPSTSVAGNLLGGVTAPPANPPQLPMPAMPTPATMPSLPAATFTVAHDHGAGGQDYCIGALAVGAGRVAYRSTNGVHTFDFGGGEIKEAKKNAVYLMALGGFHIRLKSGPNYNFVVLNAAGQYQRPDELLRVIGMSMGQY
jgi:hypothetical protein